MERRRREKQGGERREDGRLGVGGRAARSRSGPRRGGAPGAPERRSPRRRSGNTDCGPGRVTQALLPGRNASLARAGTSPHSSASTSTGYATALNSQRVAYSVRPPAGGTPPRVAARTTGIPTASAAAANAARPRRTGGRAAAAGTYFVEDGERERDPRPRRAAAAQVHERGQQQGDAEGVQVTLPGALDDGERMKGVERRRIARARPAQGVDQGDHREIRRREERLERQRSRRPTPRPTGRRPARRADTPSARPACGRPGSRSGARSARPPGPPARARRARRRPRPRGRPRRTAGRRRTDPGRGPGASGGARRRSASTIAGREPDRLCAAQSARRDPAARRPRYAARCERASGARARPIATASAAPTTSQRGQDRPRRTHGMTSEIGELLTLAAYYAVLTLLAVYGAHRAFMLCLYYRHRADVPRPAGELASSAARHRPAPHLQRGLRRRAPGRSRGGDRLPARAARDPGPRRLDRRDAASSPARRRSGCARAGFDDLTIRRADRTGFKAGALQDGLAARRGRVPPDLRRRLRAAARHPPRCLASLRRSRAWAWCRRAGATSTATTRS